MASRIPEQVSPNPTPPPTFVPTTTTTTVPGSQSTTTTTQPSTQSTTPTTPSSTSAVSGTGAGSQAATVSQITQGVLAGLTGQTDENKLNEPPIRGANYFGVRPIGSRPSSVITGVPGISGGGTGYDYQTDEPGLIGLDGQFLVDENGDRYIYDPQTEGFNAYYNSSNEQRELIADVLRDTGWTIDTIDDYVQGYQYLYEYANAAGVSFDRAVLDYRRTAPAKKRGTGPTYRVTSADDIKAVAKSVAYKTLGRGFTEAEANSFVEAYQQTQIRSQQQAASSGVSEAAPDISVSAQQFAEKVAPTEAQGIKFANHVAGFAEALKAV